MALIRTSTNLDFSIKSVIDEFQQPIIDLNYTIEEKVSWENEVEKESDFHIQSIYQTNTVEIINEFTVNCDEVITVLKTVQNCGSQPWPNTTCLVEDRPPRADHDPGLLIGAIEPNQYAYLKFVVVAPSIGGQVNGKFQFKEIVGGLIFGENINIELCVRDPPQQNIQQADNIEEEVKQEYGNQLQNDIAFKYTQKENIIKETERFVMDSIDDLFIEKKQQSLQIEAQPGIKGIFQYKTKYFLVSNESFQQFIIRQEVQPDPDIRQVKETIYQNLCQKEWSSRYNLDNNSFFFLITNIGQELQQFKNILNGTFNSLMESFKIDEESKSAMKQVKSQTRVQQWIQYLLDKPEFFQEAQQDENQIQINILNKEFKVEEFKDESFQQKYIDLEQKIFPRRGIGIIDNIIKKFRLQQTQGDEANNLKTEQYIMFDKEVFQKEITNVFVDIVLKEIDSDQKTGLIVPSRIINGIENGIVKLSKKLYQRPRTAENLYKKIFIVVNSNKRQEQIINRCEQYFDERKKEFLDLLKLQKMIQLVISPYYSLENLIGYHFIEEKQFESLFKVFKQVNQKKAAKQGLPDNTSWKSIIEENDVFVLLSKKFQELLIHGEISIDKFDIISFDEIHTVFPEHPYNSIMTSFYYNDSSQKKLPYILAFFNLSSISNESQIQSDSKIIEKLMTFSNIFNSRLLTFNQNQIQAIRDKQLSELRKVCYSESTPFLAEETFQYVYQLDKLLLKYFSDSSTQIIPHPNIFQLKKLKPFFFIYNAITGSKCTTAEAKQILENFGNKVLDIRKLLKIDKIINNKKQSNLQEPQISAAQNQSIYKIPLVTIQYVKEKHRYFTSRFEIKEDMKPLFEEGLKHIPIDDPTQLYLFHKQKLQAENWVILQVIKYLQDSKQQYIGINLRPDEKAIEQRYREFYKEEIDELIRQEEIEESNKKQQEEKERQERTIQVARQVQEAQETLKQQNEEENCQWFLKLNSFIKIVLNPILNAQSKYMDTIIVNDKTNIPKPITLENTNDFKIQKEEEKEKEHCFLDFSSSTSLKKSSVFKTQIYNKYEKICKKALGIDDSDQKYVKLYERIDISIKEDQTMTEEARVKNQKEKEEKQKILLCLLIFALMDKPYENLDAMDLAQIKTEIARLAFNGDVAINLCVVQYLYFFKDSICNEKELDKQKIEKVRSSNLKLKSQSYDLQKYMIKIDSDKPGLNREPAELLQTLCGYLSLYFGFDACFLFLDKIDLLKIEIEREKTTILQLFSSKYKMKVVEYEDKTEIFKYITQKQGIKAMKEGQQFSFNSINNMFQEAASKQKGKKEDSIKKKLLKYPNILLEAFTHKSFSERISKITDETISKDKALSSFNYQRLEYLGDSLLNYTLSHLFYYETMQKKENDPYFPASKQHEMKTWFSSNHLNSFLLVELHFNSTQKKNYFQRVPLLYDDQNSQYEQQLLEYQKQVYDKLKKYEETWLKEIAAVKDFKDALAQTNKDCQEDLQMAGLQEEYIKYFSDVLESMIGAIYLATGDFAFTQKCIIDLRSSALLDFYPIKENDRTRVLVNWNSKPYAQVLKLTHAVEENEKGTYIRGYIQSMEVIRIKFAKYQKNKVSKFYQDFCRYLDQAYKKFEREQESKQDISSLQIKTKDGRVITQWQLTETHWIEFNRFFRKTYNSNVQAEKTTVIFLEIGTKLKNMVKEKNYILEDLKLEVKVELLSAVFKTLGDKFYFEYEAERVNNIKIREIVAQLNIKFITKGEKKKSIDKEEEQRKEKTTKEDQQNNFMTNETLPAQNIKGFEMKSADTCFFDDLSWEQRGLLFDKTIELV